ncbi:MAG: hypothetical protein GX610_04305 [Rhodococcus sp.]|nr:hypothetical protein [Rhodococcus sp. (in: high G+C Gram-positive bacteria)]
MLAAIHIRQTDTPEGERTYAALAWESGGEPQVLLFGREGRTAESRYAAGLDAFAAAVDVSMQNGTPALVHITDSGLRREVAAVAESFPSVRLIDTARGQFLPMIDRATHLIGDEVGNLWSECEQRRLDERAALPELVVATDASKSFRRKGVGVACVSSEGQHRQKDYPRVGSVLAGELLAIALAIKTFRNRKLHILTDSQHAIACLKASHAELVTKGGGEVLTNVDDIHRLFHGREVRISWVRGHSGHPLNEIADRLAVSARRTFEAGVPADSRRRIGHNIVSSLELARPAA